MTKAELIERVFLTKGLPVRMHKKTVAILVDSVFAELGSYFVRAKIKRAQTPRFTYPGFGTFTKTRRKERRGRNPQTGQLILIPAQTTVTFAPGQDLKTILNRRG